MPSALIVFAKVPRPGAVKTRLSPPLSAEEAARLYDAFLRDALDAYAGLGVDLRLYLDPAGEPPPGLVPEGASLHRQQGEGLGARMLRAFVETFVAGYDRAVVIGTDHPTLPLAFAARAFEELAEPFAVTLGPSEDGGYYLLGMNELYPQLFEEMTYSHPEVFAETLERAAAVAGRVSVLPPWYDVDTPEALARLAAELAGTAGPPHRTREVVAALADRHALLA